MKLHIFPAAALLALLMPAGAYARQLSFDEAVGNVLGGQPATRSGDVRLLYTYADRGTNVAYLTTRPSSDGFMVLAADDVMPAVLGYADSGEFDADDIPPAMQGWLQGYADQLQYMLSNGLKGADPKSLPTHAAITPLCASKWSQSAPFNNNCPTIGSKVAPTGCTATAMAQAMYVHKWPKQGTGSNTYTPPALRSPLTFDFGATTFDWDNMLDSYSGSYTDAQAKAVAVLMAACGNAARMQYGASASGAYPYDALYGMVNFLGYDKGGEYVERDYYSAEQWDAMVYNELSNRRPVVYGGYNYEGGHTFVVDGYDGAGYYHLNWGWAGLSNGYFLLSALDPSSQGIGGTTGGYDFGQDALMNLKPAEVGSDYAMHIYQYGSLNTTSVFFPSIGTIEFKVDGPAEGEQGYFKPFMLTQRTVTMGVKLIPVDGGEAVFYPSAEAVTFDPYYGSTQFPAVTSFKIKASDFPKEGTFIATPAYKEGDVVSDVIVKVGYAGKIKVTCSKMGVNLEQIGPDRTFVATDVTPLTKIYSGKSVSISTTLRNSGEEYLGLVMPVLRDANGDLAAWMEGANANVLDNEPLAMTFSGIFYNNYTYAPAGNYLLDFQDEQGNYLCESPVPVTVLANPGKAVIQSTVACGDAGDGSGSNPYLTGDYLTLDLTVNVTSGVFDDKVTFYGYYANGKDLPGSASASASYFVEAGASQTRTFVIPVSDVPLNELCYVHAYGWMSGGSDASTGWFGKDIYFKHATSSVDEISGAESSVSLIGGTLHIVAKTAINGVEIYSTSGAKVMTVNADGDATKLDVNVSSITPAPYIITVTTATGLETHKLVVK